MKRLLFALLLAVTLATPTPLQAKTFQTKVVSPHEGTLQSTENARARPDEDRIVLNRLRSSEPMRLVFSRCEAISLHRDQQQWWILPTQLSNSPVIANQSVWILPLDPSSKDRAWRIGLQGGSATVTSAAAALTVVLNTQSATLSPAEARPHSDVFGNRFSLQVQDGAALEQALAAFYWGTMLPSVAEKTFAANFPYNSGYVLSTLDTKAYAGSYPAVDHEFQIKGRLAIGSDADLDVVRRMIELQFRLMNDDPEHLSRSPTSVQPDGRREYHIRRDSKDAQQNAAMFPLTANIEVVEESWLYMRARKDPEWLRSNIVNLENAAGWTMQSVDQYGRVWGDVYYEDQVIKDGRETEVQAFAARSFSLLADLEHQLGRQQQSSRYQQTATKIAAALTAPLPMGYWDAAHERFIDWVDRNSKVHDHTPLLGNTLPVTLGYATQAQAAAVHSLVQRNANEFERFPSFVAADVAAYDASEMGVAGPYDLSAAGRYWFWDAAYRAAQRQDDILLQQLQAVAAEGARSDYFMGERYDMDHVFYVDGRNAHGATKYYEYPNVYAWVLIHDYLGLAPAQGSDLSVTPHLHGNGSVEMQVPLYAVRYTRNEQQFTLTNLADKSRSFDVDLSSIYPAASSYRLQGTAGIDSTGSHTHLTLAARQTATWKLTQQSHR